MNHVPKRPRKLLLHRREIDKLATKTGEKGLTLVPLSIYFKKGMAKVELSVARGRKMFDKREALKKQDAKRDIDRAMRRRLTSGEIFGKHRETLPFRMSFVSFRRGFVWLRFVSLAPPFPSRPGQARP